VVNPEKSFPKYMPLFSLKIFPENFCLNPYRQFLNPKKTQRPEMGLENSKEGFAGLVQVLAATLAKSKGFNGLSLGLLLNLTAE